MKTMIRFILLCFCVGLAAGCKNEVRVHGEGYVSSSGFQVLNCEAAVNDGGVAPVECVAEYTSEEYDLLTATPAPGWVFDEWDTSYSADPCYERPSNVCERDVTQNLLDLDPSIDSKIAAIFRPILPSDHAKYWNKVFEAPPSSTSRWTGGDHVSSVELPFCDTCPEGQQYRRLWFFGDSFESEVSDVPEGLRENRDVIWGNSVAFTYHGANASFNQINQIEFDWGSQGILELDQNAWLPSFTPPAVYDFLHPYSRRVRGYAEDSADDYFNSTKDIARVYDRPQSVGAVFPVLTTRPIYEYYDASLQLSNYRTENLGPNDGVGGVYRGIAFHVLKDPAAGAVKLYSYRSNLFNSVLLTLTQNLSGFGFQLQEELGYVYPANVDREKTAPLTQFYRNQSGEYHHNYVLRREIDKSFARGYSESVTSPQNGGNLISVYRYMNTATGANDYSTVFAASIGGYDRQELAFKIHDTQVADSIPLYRYFSVSDAVGILSTDVDLHIENSNALNDPDSFQFQPPGSPLGYVFPYVINRDSKNNTSALYQKAWGSDYSFAGIKEHAGGENPAKIGTWPLQGIVLGTDLVVGTRATDLFDEQGFRGLDTTLFSVIPNANLPRDQWGKTPLGDWLTPPNQYRVIHSNNRTLWGITFLKDAAYDGVTTKWVYIYGTQALPFILNQVVVARVSAATGAELVDFSSWEFWDGSGWTSESEDAAPILDSGASITPQFSLFTNPQSSNVIMVSAGLTSAGSDGKLRFMVASTPTGPFVQTSEQDIVSPYQGPNSRYRAGEFHDIALDGSGAIFSYIHTGSLLGDNVKTNYVPQFISVPWSVIEP